MKNNIYNKATFYKRLFLLVILIIILIILSVFLGSANVSLRDTVRIILSNIINISLEDIKTSSVVIINNVRLPRVLLAVLVGAGISACGTSYQSILKSNIVDPFMLGISSGAAFGATLALIFKMDNLLRPFAFIFAILVSLIVVYISKKTSNKLSLVLIGINLNYFISALISLLMFLNDNSLERVYYWTMGSLSGASFDAVLVLFLIVVPGIILLSILGKYLNAISIDTTYAKSIGIDIEKVTKLVIIVTSIITAVIVSYSGIIGFIGLMVPHITKLIFGNDNRYIIPYSACIGALILLLCDNAARMLLSPSELPVGVITSLIGAPITLGLILRKGRDVR